MSIRGSANTSTAAVNETRSAFLRSPTLVALLALALAGAGVALLASPAAASHGDGVEAGESIQAAINHADPGDTIEIGAGTYEEALTVAENESGAVLEGLTLRATGDVTVDASDADRTVVDIQAPDVTLDGLSLVWDGSVGEESIVGVDVTGSGALLDDVAIDLPAFFCEVESGACDDPKVTGVNAQASTTVRHSELTTEVVDEDDLNALGTRGVNVLTHGDVVVDNGYFTGWGAAVQVWKPNAVVTDSTFELNFRGVHMAADSVEISLNAFEEHDAAVYVAGSSDFSPTDVTVRNNDMKLSNNKAISFEADKSGADIDAELNEWGVVKEELIENSRIGWTSDTAENRENEVDVHPYLNEDGEQVPPRPDVMCFTGENETLSKVADTRTLQRAIDLDLPAECLDRDDDGDIHRTIVLEPSFEEYDGATVDTEITLLSNVTQRVDNVATEGALDFGARIQAQQDEPALRFVEGSQDSRVEGLGLQGEPVGTTAILAEDISGHSGITIEDVGIGSRNNDASQGVVLRNVDGVELRSSTVLSGDPIIELDQTAHTKIVDNRLVQQAPTDAAGSDATGILATDANAPQIEDNVIIGNSASGSVGLDVRGSSQPVVTGNIVAKVADGLVVNATAEATIASNTVAFPPVDLGLENTGLTLDDGADHTVDRNTFQFADVGLSIEGAEDVEGDLNRFNATSTGVSVSDLDEGELDGVDDLVLNNGSLAETVDPLILQTSAKHLDVNAECNDWGVYTNDSVNSRITDLGQDNDVDAQPFTSPTADGDVECLVPPDAAFSWEVQEPITRLDDVDFVDESEEGTYDIESYQWDFGDGTTSDEQNPTHSFDGVGEFFVELTVSDTVNMSSSKVHKLTVENIEPELDPIQDVEIEHSQQVSIQAQAQDAEGDNLTFEAFLVENGEEKPLPQGASFTDNGDGTADFDWDPTPDQDGSYDIRVNVTDGYDTVTEEFEITVINQPPEFDPELPGVLGGAVDRTVTLDVNPIDPDEFDEIESLSANLSELPADKDQIWTKDTENKTGTLEWTPDTGDNGTYEISFTTSSPGYTVTVPVTVDIREDNSAPTIIVTANDPFVDGGEAEVFLEADDDEGDTINWSARTPAAIEDQNTSLVTLTDSGDEAKWTWDIPRNTSGSYDVTFVADDGFGDVETEETIAIESHPWVDSRLPKETETGVFTIEPLVGSEVLLSFHAVDIDGELSPSDMAVNVDGQTLSVDQLDDDLYGATYEFTETGTFSAEFVVTDADGNEGSDTLDFIQVQPNEPPSVEVDDDLIWTNSTDPSGAQVTLSGSAEDPEGRTLEEDDFEWQIPGQPNPKGREVTATLNVGTHNIDLVVTDPFGESSTKTVVVKVDDTIAADGQLDAPQDDNGVYQVDPVQHSFGELTGTVDVVDDVANGVEGAVITGTVQYYGAEANDVGVTVASFEVQTDSSGQATFSYQQEILGAQPTDLQASLLSAPGWHEIDLEVTASSRSAAPLQDNEFANDTIEYFVAPTAPSDGEAGVHASAACFDGPASDDDRNGAQDEARVTVTPSGDTRTTTPGADNVTEGAATFAEQGGDCHRGFAQASLLVFDFIVQACYDGEASVHVDEAPCPTAGDGVPISPPVEDPTPEPPEPPESSPEEVAAWGVEGQGACYYDGQGAEDDAHVTYQFGEGLDTERPGLENVQAALSACAGALTDGELPEGGSFLALTGTAGNGALAVQIDTVPVSDHLTGERLGPTGVQAEGACFYDGEGGGDSTSVFLGPPEPEPEANGPDVANVLAGLTACGNAVADGSTPDGGSHASFTATVAGSTVLVTADTVPVSNALTP